MSLCIPRDDVTAPLITDFSAAFSAIKSAEDLTEQVIPLTTSIFHDTTAIVGFFPKGARGERGEQQIIQK